MCQNIFIYLFVNLDFLNETLSCQSSGVIWNIALALCL